jgi:hypothetical protein
VTITTPVPVTFESMSCKPLQIDSSVKRRFPLADEDRMNHELKLIEKVFPESGIEQAWDCR